VNPNQQELSDNFEHPEDNVQESYLRLNTQKLLLQKEEAELKV
jgi:hypothetical protein